MKQYLLGRITRHQWGWDLRTRRGWLVYSRWGGQTDRPELYWSPDATPRHAQTRMLWRGKKPLA
jgi:hypothetical protein